MLPDRLTWIDETNRADHRYLEEADRCLFCGEYFGNQSYKGGDTNQLIFNYKCPPSKAAANPWRRGYKEQAIHTIAATLRRVLSQRDAEKMTWVPIPTSKAIGHPDYDDRAIRTLTEAFKGYDVDIRLLLRQIQSTEADHSSSERISPEALQAVLQVDVNVLSARSLRHGIVLFDDVVTTGKHFKCCQARLGDAVPAEFGILGLFVARRILPNPAEEFEDLGPL